MRQRLLGRLRASKRGQSIVELGVLLPFLLALTGGAVDFGRAYQVQVTLQSATRNAAEYVATNSGDADEAQADGRRVVCLEMRQTPVFRAGPGGDEECEAPSVTVVLTLSTTAQGATPEHPIGTATVTSTASFRTVVPWPMLPQSFTFEAESTFRVIQGRDR